MRQAGSVKAGELVFVGAGHIAVGLMVLVDVYCVLDDYLGGEASETVFCCFGSLLLPLDVHSCPLGGEVAVLVHIKLPPCLPLVSKSLFILQSGLVLALDSGVKFLGLLA